MQVRVASPVRIHVDDETVPARPGESLLLALLRADRHPVGGGCLCLAGDCPHCLVTVDGISYVRSCQVPVREGMRVERTHRRGQVPPLPPADVATGTTPVRHVHCDLAVVGQGPSGRNAAAAARDQGQEVVTLEAASGEEVVGIYPGPLVVARTPTGMLQLHPRREIVVATGAAEIQPVVPGNGLSGLVTARAATVLAAADLELGRVVAIGRRPSLPDAVDLREVEGELLRCEGDGKLHAVVVRDPAGSERRYRCDTLSLGLGLQPRDTLGRMGRGLPLRVVGDAARPPDLPPCPRAGMVCPCAGVQVEDLDSVWRRGFRELELVKRATLVGTGTCQGAVCVPHLRSFLLDRGKELQPPFTARPVSRQPTLGEIAAGAHHPPTARTPLDAEHRRLGAQMERSGGWWRPWSYGDPAAEYEAVRGAVSLGDVSTLGKFTVSGPDALAFLEHLYPTRVVTLEIGRSRYALLLDERGYVLDDGMICRDGESRFLLTLTSAGSTFGELWLRDWADAGDYDVRIANQTMSRAAINVTGPRAGELLAAAGCDAPPPFAAHRPGRVAGIDCRIFRLSFTGELSFELHQAAADSVTLWRRLLALGEPMAIRPHGLQALLDLRLEKGHLVIGQDTAFDSTPRRLGHEWAVKLDKGEFVGRRAVLRTNREPLDRRLVGLEMEGAAPQEGAVIWHQGAWAGLVTSSARSPGLGKAVMLAWLHVVDGELPTTVTVDGRTARRVELPFYDPGGGRARAPAASGGAADRKWSSPAADPARGREAVEPATGRFRRLEATRIVAAPEALDGAGWPEKAPVLRVADDEALVLGRVPAAAIADPHAVVERETGFSGAWIPAAEAREILARTCSWEPPDRQPAQAQGAVAGVPVKLLFEGDRVLFLVASPWAVDLEERLA